MKVNTTKGIVAIVAFLTLIRPGIEGGAMYDSGKNWAKNPVSLRFD